jgi:DNA polymerase-2
MRVEAYEAVTAFGRHILMSAKEIAEEMGFRVLSFNVDGLYVKKEGADKEEDFEPLLKEIERRTKMPIALDGFFKWMVFLPSRVDKRVPVANRFFGAFKDGSVRVRGIEMRRHDTPPFVYQAQADVLRRMAAALGDVSEEELVTEVLDMMRLRVSQLRAGAIPVEDLLITQRLSRAPGDYKVPSPGGKAAKQLEMLGKNMQPGMRVQFMFTHTKLGVTAWQAGHPMHIDTIDTERYIRLLVRAVHNIISVFGIDEELIREQVSGQLWLLPYVWQKEEVVGRKVTSLRYVK